MKRWLLIVFTLAFASSALAEGVWSDTSEAYYHKDVHCDFGTEFSWNEAPSRLECSVADCGTQTACPSCASDWLPRFTGVFPEWVHERNPWACGDSFETQLPDEICRSWLDDPNVGWSDETSVEWPSFYAGRFVNASGGLTVMIVQPTEERVQALRILIGGDFWALSAAYGWKELLALQDAVDSLMGEDLYAIHGSSPDPVRNRVIIAVDDDSEKVRERIVAALREQGFSDARMILVCQEERACPFD